MTILRDISFLWSILHVILLFLILFEPRYSWRTTFLAAFAGAGTILCVNVFAMLWMGHGIIMSAAFFTCTIPSMLLFFALSKYRDGRFFFLFCLTDTTCFWLLQITNFLDRMTGDTYVVMLITRLLVFPLIELLFWHYLRRPYLELQSSLDRNWWMFAATGAVYYLLIMVSSVPVGAPMPDAQGLLLILLVLLLMPLTYLTILRALWRQMQVYESSKQVELLHQDYQRSLQKMELGRIYRHDMHHHLLVLEGMLQQGDSSGALRYIQQLNGKLTKLSRTVWCANTAVNAALTAYLTEAVEADCQVDARADLPAELPYGEMDLCISLSNALENAIRACRDAEEGQRDIRVRLSLTDQQQLTLSVDNSCPRPVEFDSSGLPISPVREGHGLGLRSIQIAAEQYGGLFRCRWEAGRFYLQAVRFPPNQRR